MAEGGEFGNQILTTILTTMTSTLMMNKRSTQQSHFGLARCPPPTMVVNNMKCKLCSTNRADFPKHHLMKKYLCWGGGGGGGGFIHEDDKPARLEKAK